MKEAGHSWNTETGQKTRFDLALGSSSQTKRSGEITLKLEDYEDYQKIEGVLNGNTWMRQVNGKLEFRGAFEPLDYSPDPDVEDIWRPRQTELFPPVIKIKEKEESGIYVQHICGYNGREVYQERAKLMEECGFECLRSRRGKNGRYWEIWYLPGKWAAKGPIQGLRELNTIVSWLFNNIAPGNVYIENEGWGLGAD